MLPSVVQQLLNNDNAVAGPSKFADIANTMMTEVSGTDDEALN